MLIRLVCKSACRVIRTPNSNLLNFLFSVETREHNSSSSSNAHLYNCKVYKVLYYAFFFNKDITKKSNITLLALSGSVKHQIRQMKSPKQSRV